MAWRTSTHDIPTGNRGNARTLAAMRMLSSRGSIDPVVIQAAQDIVRTVPERDDDATFRAVLRDVRRRMRYTHDPLGAELVKDPALVVGMSDAAFGSPEPMDCDDASVLTASFLGALGYQTRFVTVATDRTRPDEWTHVYVSARKNDGQWVAMDPIVRSFGPGDEVPERALTAPRAYHEGATTMRMGCSNYRLAGYGMGEAAPTTSWWEDAINKATTAYGQSTSASIAKSQANIAQAGARRDIALARLANKRSGNPFQNADGTTNWAVVGVAGAVAVGLFVLITKKK